MKKIVLIGYGKMGSSIVNGWLKNNLNYKLYIIEKEQIKNNNKLTNQLMFYKSFDDFFKLKFIPDIVFIAVKPQQIIEIKKNIKLLYSNNTIFISIAAGISSNWFKKNVSSKIKIVRAMPNIPASILRGITGVFYSKNLKKIEIKNIKKILECIGSVVFLKKENQIDIITSISGSGPAYFFLLTEVLYKLGKKFGLEDNDAKLFSKSTFIGSASLLDSSELSVSRLRDNVTSPGGTTEAALKILMDKEDGLDFLIEKALKAAILRAKKLNIK